ncbi:hypothetical protein RhiirA1_406413 [Rhizophagus irregularis]|uniref:Uncharacterized protein n=2 Tax=Rhizophagus irregularis TaxID=588596 RepID=A0A2I1F7V6_9GLOM|nr:hypothetical protein RhiirA1_406413 [Rhizophagus irregularis]PKY30450.1 hypothetical protein RhiirB3_418744 [Rhizophagus irregularis]
MIPVYLQHFGSVPLLPTIPQILLLFLFFRGRICGYMLYEEVLPRTTNYARLLVHEEFSI